MATSELLVTITYCNIAYLYSDIVYLHWHCIYIDNSVWKSHCIIYGVLGVKKTLCIIAFSNACIKHALTEDHHSKGLQSSGLYLITVNMVEKKLRTLVETCSILGDFTTGAMAQRWIVNDLFSKSYARKCYLINEY